MATEHKPDPKPGELVLCGGCGAAMTPYTPPYPPEECLCPECDRVVGEMIANGELG